MKKITWNDLEEIFEIPYFTVGRWMDFVEVETGKFPDWNDCIPERVYNLI